MMRTRLKVQVRTNGEMTRYERKLRDEIIAAALKCQRSDDTNIRFEAEKRLWEAVEKLDKAHVNDKIFISPRGIGRPKTLPEVAIIADAKAGLSVREIAHKHNTHRNNIYNVLKRFQNAELPAT